MQPPEARPGRRKAPRWRAERRRTFARRCAHKDWLRPSARHPLANARVARNTGVPGARQTTRAMMLTSFLIPPLKGKGRIAEGDPGWGCSSKSPHLTLAALASALLRKRERDKKARPSVGKWVFRTFAAPWAPTEILRAIPHCAGRAFLAISARFPVGVKRPFKRPSSTLLAPGGSVSSASSVYQSRLRPP